MSRSVTLHGFALNCTTDLAWYDPIVPCGLADRGVASLSEVAGREITVTDALPVVARRLADVFGAELQPAPLAASASLGLTERPVPHG
jgi:lipoyl(octanoyl) transferase